MNFRDTRIYFLSVNILLALGLIYGFSWMIFNWISNYTRHDIYVKIPDLSSLDLKQAMLLLDKKGLKYDIDTTQYNPDFKPYKIFFYVPESGDHVKPGRHIFIRANAGRFIPVPLPEILQTNERIARMKLSEKNILLGQLTYAPNTSEGVVLKVLYMGHEIQSGTLLPYQAKVDLIIGKDCTKNILIPDLIKMDLLSAKKLLQEKKISLGEIVYSNSKNIQNARIYRQKPESGQIYNEGKNINIWLSDISQPQFDSLVLQYKPKKEILGLISTLVPKKEEYPTSTLKKVVAPKLNTTLDQEIIIE